MGGTSFEEGALAPAGSVLKNAREARVNVDVAPQATRKESVELLAIPWSRDTVKKEGTRILTVVISAAAAGPYPSSISLQLLQTISELWRADLTNFGRGRWPPAEGGIRKSAHLRDGISDGAGGPFLDPGPPR